ncbi:hypothetical protein [Streptosporangium sp. NPDC049078]|uniref:hypothetical protein n=1 Tax=Streptosporangium sp. NPDC049078 TaxID=3155767 RepID=UPI00342921C0
MSAADRLPQIEYGVRWTPSTGAERVETSPISKEHAAVLAGKLRYGQWLFCFPEDADVVYRLPGGPWRTSRFLIRVQQTLSWGRRFRFDQGADLTL